MTRKRTKDSYEHRVNWYKKGKSPRMTRTWAIACEVCGWDWRLETADKKLGNDTYRNQDIAHRAHHERKLDAGLDADRSVSDDASSAPRKPSIL